MAENLHQVTDLSGGSLAHDRYRLEELLGRDDQMTWYRATDTHLDATVAIHLVHSHVAQAPTPTGDFGARFVQAARAGVMCNHPALMRLFDFGIIHDTYFVVGELLPARTLDDCLRDLRQVGCWVTLEEALALVAQVGDALAYLVRHNLPLRRVDPAAIKVCAPRYAFATRSLSFAPILVDLPLDMDRRVREAYAQARVFSYLGPAADGDSGSPAADSDLSPAADGGDEPDACYALGTLGWELAVGRVPDAAGAHADAQQARAEGRAEGRRTPAHRLHPDLPESVARWLDRAPAVAPPTSTSTLSRSDGFGSLDEMLEMLAAIAPEIGRDIVPTGCAVGHVLDVTAPTPGHTDAARAETQTASAELTPSPPVAARHIDFVGTDQVSFSVPLTQAPISIGRSVDNGVILDDPRISRKHARVEVENSTVYLVDLNSANGVLLGEQFVTPGERTPWPEETPARIGAWLLQLTHRPTETPASAPPPTDSAHSPRLDESNSDAADAAQDRGASLELRVEQDSYAVEPGTRLALPVFVRNVQRDVTLFSVSVVGVPENWLTYPTSVAVAPGAEECLTLMVAPPREHSTAASEYALQIVLTRAQGANEVVFVKVMLHITTFVGLRAELVPPTVHTDETMCVQVFNEGNDAQQVKLTWWDNAHELRFQPEEAEIVVEPGATQAVEVHTSPKKSGWSMRAKHYPVTVQAHSRDGGTLLARGTVVHRGAMTRRSH